ncbi:cytochrome b/b6 domain-containing protein [Paraglaciecola aquimarina]|uniref:Cytochrome b/b6 domain-containing protein n=1 Tax=Paraglaciecola algarum TaxID=3050085 RepID=A0ABS9D4L8_9ALTE|nr:cytochrome b/b6 domain-containing protein [Paraglaciecola sp. G1-23]MCF2947868.1 cytochrome b/b6 domain-containing protein [Paraglaciecola sp. G1-23]
MQIKVWDLATRLFHWVLVLNIFLAWYTIENRMIELHEIAGHSLLALLVFRVLWGVIGSSTARFTQFIKYPRVAIRYLINSVKFSTPHSTGHNPAGGWMVIVMLVILGFQVISGMLSNNDLGFSGALSDYVSKGMSDTFTQLHSLSFDFILFIVWIHLVAVFFYVLVKKDNLVKAMFSGDKNIEQTSQSEKVKLAPQYFALICLGCSVSLAYWLWV